MSRSRSFPRTSGTTPAFADRFAREAKALARLNHPGIVTLYEFGRAGGDTNREAARPQPLYYFLMEFVNGVNLRQVLEAGRMSPREALAIVPQICDALQYAHDQGIVHRDIKPENILLDRQGHVKVADFGLAKLVGDSRSGRGRGRGSSPASTGAGTVMGTPQYMAPEQRERPTEVDHRADIYSLGVVFYQMLTGELPARARSKLRRRKCHVDVRLDEVVLRALEKEPERRYQHVSEVKSAVETIATTQRSADASAAPVDAASNAAARALPTAEFEHARQLVLIPAIGMMVVSSYTLAVAGFALLAWFGLAMNSGNPRVAPTPWPISNSSASGDDRLQYHIADRRSQDEATPQLQTGGRWDCPVPVKPVVGDGNEPSRQTRLDACVACHLGYLDGADLDLRHLVAVCADTKRGAGGFQKRRVRSTRNYAVPSGSHSLPAR